MRTSAARPPHRERVSATPPIAPSEITAEMQYLMTRRTALHAVCALMLRAPAAGVRANSGA
jgi:hypothetical protein